MNQETHPVRKRISDGIFEALSHSETEFSVRFKVDEAADFLLYEQQRDELLSKDDEVEEKSPEELLSRIYGRPVTVETVKLVGDNLIKTLRAAEEMGRKAQAARVQTQAKIKAVVDDLENAISKKLGKKVRKGKELKKPKKLKKKEAKKINSSLKKMEREDRANSPSHGEALFGSGKPPKKGGVTIPKEFNQSKKDDELEIGKALASVMREANAERASSVSDPHIEQLVEDFQREGMQAP